MFRVEIDHNPCYRHVDNQCPYFQDIVVLTFRYGDVAPILPAPAAVAQENNASTATTSNELLVSRRESRLHDPSDSFLAIFGEQDGTSTSAGGMIQEARILHFSMNLSAHHFIFAHTINFMY